MKIRTRISTRICCTLTHNWTRIITFSEKARKKKFSRPGINRFLREIN